MAQAVRDIIDYVYDNGVNPPRQIHGYLTSCGLGDRRRQEEGLKRAGRYHLVAWWKEHDFLDPAVLMDWVQTNPSFTKKHKDDMRQMMERSDVGGWSASSSLPSKEHKKFGGRTKGGFITMMNRDMRRRDLLSNTADMGDYMHDIAKLRDLRKRSRELQRENDRLPIKSRGGDASRYRANREELRRIGDAIARLERKDEVVRIVY